MIQSGNVIGQYMVERLISNEGGMSQIFLGRELERTKHKVAIKVNLTEDSNHAAFQDILRNETLVLSQMRHPNIVHIHPLRLNNNRVGYSSRTIPNGPYYYAMEYIPGKSLEKLVPSITRKMPIGWRLELFYQLVITIDYMHKKGYAHCDLKPANIIFRNSPHSNQMPTPVLIDFGSASPVSQMGRMTASVRYSPPEILMSLDRPDLTNGIRGDKVDIWGLGVIFYEILVGHPLFDQKDRRAATTTILRGELKTMSQLQPDIPQVLDRLLIQMLSRDASLRPTTDELIMALDEKMAFTRPPRIAIK